MYNYLVSINHILISCNLLFADLTPPTEATLVPIVNNSDPAILRWTKPNLTDDNREFFQGYDVSFDRAVLDTTLSGRRKRNVLATETQTQRIGPDETSYNYNISCPYNTSFTLCPYSRYIFSVISVFAFRSIPIDNSELASVDIRTNESSEFRIFEMFCTLLLHCVVST